MNSDGEIRIKDAKIWIDPHGTAHTEDRGAVIGCYLSTTDSPFTAEHPWLCFHTPGEDCPTGVITADDFQSKFLFAPNLPNLDTTGAP